MQKRRVLGVAIAVLGAVGAVRLVRAALSGDKTVPSGSARTYVLERTQVIPAPIDRVIPLFEDPHNLGRLTPPSMGFEIIAVENLPVRAGTTIEYRIRPFGVPQCWVTEIEAYVPGRMFTDVQRRGPYRYWRHQHVFEDLDGRTLMVDRVEYQLPLGYAGRLAHALVVARELRRIFDFRAEAVVRILGREREAEA